MALAKKTIIDKIEVDPESGTISVRRATFIEEDGQRFGVSMYHREVYEPAVASERMAKEDVRVQEIAALIWTPEIIVKAEEREELRRASQALIDHKVGGQGGSR